MNGLPALLQGWPAYAIVGVLLVCMGILCAAFLRERNPLSRLTLFEAFIPVLLCLVVLWAMWGGAGSFLDFVLILSLVGFLSGATVAKYIERGGISDE